mmetsp:Transcript_70822/g.195637  ORF Transcript_70822/g.195637 Transcript_70822/m.195637 type:complete len:295 (+) Transcript_70822:2027-2911(+)
MEVAPPTGPLVATALGGDAPEEPSPPRQTDEVPPGACENRGAAPGVSRLAPRDSWYWPRMTLESSLPSTTLEAPPTGGLAQATSPTGTAEATSPPKPMEELPPGACWKRGAAAGVSTATWRSSLYCAKITAESSLPRTTVAAPPTGPLPPAPLPTGASEVSAPKQTEDKPPGACGNLGVAPGVSTTASRASLRWLKTSCASSLPRMTVDAPPAGTRRVAAPAMDVLAGSPPRQIEVAPPGACWNRGAAAGVSTRASRCSLCWLKASAGSSLPRTTLTVPPTGPLEITACSPSVE